MGISGISVTSSYAFADINREWNITLSQRKKYMHFVTKVNLNFFYLIFNNSKIGIWVILWSCLLNICFVLLWIGKTLQRGKYFDEDKSRLEPHFSETNTLILLLISLMIVQCTLVQSNKVWDVYDCMFLYRIYLELAGHIYLLQYSIIKSWASLQEKATYNECQLQSFLWKINLK